MKITSEKSLDQFEFWSGANDNFNLLTDDEAATIEAILEDEYPDGIDETVLNDIFRFDFETVCDWIGTTPEALERRANGDEEENQNQDNEE